MFRGQVEKAGVSFFYELDDNCRSPQWGLGLSCSPRRPVSCGTATPVAVPGVGKYVHLR